MTGVSELQESFIFICPEAILRCWFHFQQDLVLAHIAKVTNTCINP